jgi:hypothetical protein
MTPPNGYRRPQYDTSQQIFLNKSVHERISQPISQGILPTGSSRALFGEKVKQSAKQAGGRGFLQSCYAAPRPERQTGQLNLFRFSGLIETPRRGAHQQNGRLTRRNGSAVVKLELDDLRFGRHSRPLLASVVKVVLHSGVRWSRASRVFQLSFCARCSSLRFHGMFPRRYILGGPVHNKLSLGSDMRHGIDGARWMFRVHWITCLIA